MRAKLLAVAAVLGRAFELRDIFVFGGIAVATNGVAGLSGPAAWIFCGLMLVWLGLGLGLRKR